LKVAGLEVKPEKREKKLVKVGEITDGTDVNLPFIVVNGAEDGPTLVLRGGEHGSEYCGQEAVRQVSLQVNAEQLSGAVIAIPNCNPLAYRDGSYKNFRVYDLSAGNAIDYSTRSSQGAFDQRVSNIIWEEALSKADVSLSIHDGATHWIARYIANVLFTDEMKDLGERTLAIAKAFGVGLPISHKKTPSFTGAAAELAKRGVPAIVPEVGGMRMLWKNDVARGVKGITNVMKYMKMIEGQPEPSKQIVFEEQIWIRCNRGGVMKPAFSPLDIPLTVSKGEKLCSITNLLGDEVEVVESPFKGVVLCARSTCSVHTGDSLYSLGKID
jgi:hypothetical protein